MPNAYAPIACSAREELLPLAASHRACAIRYRDAAHEEQEARAVIKDVYTRGDEEFLRLSTGLEVRLDHLIAVEGTLLQPSC
jgi:transcriptional antiterminator Rof (Rho-off)